MIRISPTNGADRGVLTPAEQHGLDVLLDLSRLVRVRGTEFAVEIELVESANQTHLAECIARRWLLDVTDGRVRLPRSVLRIVTAISGAADEQRATARDKFGRVLAADNALVKVAAHDGPVLSQAARFLKAAVIEAAGKREVLFVTPWPDRRR